VPQTHVVILSGRSLFVEGVAARLRQKLPAEDLVTIDAQEGELLARVIQAQPVAVILDGRDEAVTRRCPIGALIAALPNVTIIRLDPYQDQVQVVTSEQRAAERVADLLAVITTAEQKA
jgi:hypothetical protein